MATEFEIILLVIAVVLFGIFRRVGKAKHQGAFAGQNCPHCQERISGKARRCPHCQGDVPERVWITDPRYWDGTAKKPKR
jgi:hypothetical protein